MKNKPRFFNIHALLIFSTILILSLGFKPDNAEASTFSNFLDDPAGTITRAVSDTADWACGSCVDALEYVWDRTVEYVKETYKDLDKAINDLADGQIRDALYNLRDAVVDVTNLVVPYEDLLYAGYRVYMDWINEKGSNGYKLDPYLIYALQSKYSSYDPNLLKDVRVYYSSRAPSDGIASSVDAVTDCSRIYFNDWQMTSNVQNAYYTSPTYGVRLDKDDLKLLLHELTHVQQCKRTGGRKRYAIDVLSDYSETFISELIRGRDLSTKNIHSNADMEKEAINNAQSLIDGNIYASVQNSANIIEFLRTNSLVGVNLCGGDSSRLPLGYVTLDAGCVVDYVAPPDSDMALGPYFIVEQGTKANFMARAGHSVILKDGFTAKAGSKVRVFVKDSEHAPVLAGIGNQTAYVGYQLYFSVSGTDLDNERLIYSIANNPSGLFFRLSDLQPSMGGIVLWTPGTGQAGTYSVTFTVTDANGLSDSETVQITVLTGTPPGSWPPFK